MNKQQAIASIRSLQGILSSEDRPFDVNLLSEALDTLDDTHNGWSNRETWAVVGYLGKNKTLREHAQYWLNQGDSIEEFVTRIVYSRPDVQREIGSLWRVNWDEVVEALQGK